MKRGTALQTYCQSKRAGTHGVTGRFLFWAPGLPTAHLYTDKRNVHPLYSSHSPSTLVSDNKKHVVGYTVAHSVNADD
jgi:hypothetical protein